MVVMQKPAPLIGEQGAVGLYHIIYMPATGIALLKLHGLLIKRQGAQHGLSPMPGEEHAVGCLRLDIHLHKALKQLVGHLAAAALRIEVLLFKVVAVGATQVALRAHGLGKHIKGLGEWGDGWAVVFFHDSKGKQIC